MVTLKSWPKESVQSTHLVILKFLEVANARQAIPYVSARIAPWRDWSEPYAPRRCEQ